MRLAWCDLFRAAYKVYTLEPAGALTALHKTLDEYRERDGKGKGSGRGRVCSPSFSFWVRQCNDDDDDDDDDDKNNNNNNRFSKALYVRNFVLFPLVNSLAAN